MLIKNQLCFIFFITLIQMPHSVYSATIEIPLNCSDVVAVASRVYTKISNASISGNEPLAVNYSKAFWVINDLGSNCSEMKMMAFELNVKRLGDTPIAIKNLPKTIETSTLTFSKPGKYNGKGMELPDMELGVLKDNDFLNKQQDLLNRLRNEKLKDTK